MPFLTTEMYLPLTKSVLFIIANHHHEGVIANTIYRGIRWIKFYQVTIKAQNMKEDADSAAKF